MVGKNGVEREGKDRWKQDEQKEYETDFLKVVIPNCLY